MTGHIGFPRRRRRPAVARRGRPVAHPPSIRPRSRRCWRGSLHRYPSHRARPQSATQALRGPRSAAARRVPRGPLRRRSGIQARSPSDCRGEAREAAGEPAASRRRRRRRSPADGRREAGRCVDCFPRRPTPPANPPPPRCWPVPTAATPESSPRRTPAARSFPFRPDRRAARIPIPRRRGHRRRGRCGSRPPVARRSPPAPPVRKGCECSAAWPAAGGPRESSRCRAGDCRDECWPP